jgi:hypothetical protein
VQGRVQVPQRDIAWPMEVVVPAQRAWHGDAHFKQCLISETDRNMSPAIKTQNWPECPLDRTASQHHGRKVLHLMISRFYPRTESAAGGSAARDGPSAPRSRPRSCPPHAAQSPALDTPRGSTCSVDRYGGWYLCGHPRSFIKQGKASEAVSPSVVSGMAQLSIECDHHSYERAMHFTRHWDQRDCLVMTNSVTITNSRTKLLGKLLACSSSACPAP